MAIFIEPFEEAAAAAAAAAEREFTSDTLFIILLNFSYLFIAARVTCAALGSTDDGK